MQLALDLAQQRNFFARRVESIHDPRTNGFVVVNNEGVTMMRATSLADAMAKADRLEQDVRAARAWR